MNRRMRKTAALLALIPILACSMVGCGSVNSVVTKMKHGEYEDAIAYYGKLSLNDTQEDTMMDKLFAYLEEKIESYQQEECTYEEIEAYEEALETLIEAMEDENSVYKLLEYELEVYNLKTSLESYETAMEYFEEEDYSLAYTYFGKIEDDCVKYEDAQAKLIECITLHCAEIESAVEAYLDREEYYEALGYLYALSSSIDSECADTIDSLEESVNQGYREEISSKFESYSEQGYEQARSYLNNVSTNYASDDVKDLVDSLYSEIYVSEVVAEVQGYIDAGEYLKAISTIEDYESWYAITNSTTLDELADTALSGYVAYISAQASSLSAVGKYDQAIEILEEAQGEVTSSELSTLLDEIMELRPVYITDLKISTGDNYLTYSSTDVIEDTVGNTYAGTYVLGLKDSRSSTTTTSGTGYVEYFLNGEYTTLTGTLAVNDKTTDAEYNNKIVFRVYGDNDEVLYKKTVTRTTTPVELNIDLSGVQWLRIELEGLTTYKTTYSTYTGYFYILLDNCQLTKE